MHTGELACAGCYKSDWKLPSTLVKFSHDGMETTKFSRHFGSEHDHKCFPDPVKLERWVFTEGSRGYTTWDLKEGYEKLAEGWMTGWPDDSVRRKLDFAEFCGRLEKGEITPPAPICMIFGVTANVYTTSTCIAVAAKDVEQIEKWLETVDESVDELEDQLS
jgi:hypothetical protein